MRSAECGIEGRASLPHSECRVMSASASTTRPSSDPRTAPPAYPSPGSPRHGDARSVVATTRRRCARSRRWTRSVSRFPSSVSRTPAPRVRPAPPPPVAAHLAPEACQAYSAFRTPHSALGFIVDQRVAAFGDARPWLDGDDVVQHRALEPELDLVDGGAERAASAGPGGGARVAREELQLGGARREPGALDGEPLHGPGGGRLLEARLERRGDAIPVRRRVLERRLGEPRRAVLELGARTYHLYPPAGAARVPERALDQLLQRVREQFPLGNRRAEWGVRTAESSAQCRRERACIEIPHSALRTPHLIASAIRSGPPYNPSNPSVPTNTLPSAGASMTGLTAPRAESSRANCSS